MNLNENRENERTPARIALRQIFEIRLILLLISFFVSCVPLFRFFFKSGHPVTIVSEAIGTGHETLRDADSLQAVCRN